jgi:hypothetical protein
MTAPISFDKWMQALREDCARNHKLPVLDNMGNFVLEWLWRGGVEPSVNGLLLEAASIKPAEL